MIEILIQLAPIYLYFGLGVILRTSGVANKDHGEFILRLVMMVTLPLLILATLPLITMTLNKAILPVGSIAISFACMLITLILIKLFKVERKQAGTVLVSTMILNNLYMFPFILFVYGNEAFTDAILFDLGNTLLMSTYVYLLAFKYGGEEHRGMVMLNNMLRSPVTWSIVISLVLAIIGIRLPQAVFDIITPVAQMTAPLILISLGIFFSLHIKDVKMVGMTVLVRMVMGLLFGVAIANYLKLSDTTFIVVALCGAAPVGFNALTLSSMAKLDSGLSSSAISVSTLAGLIFIPLLMIYIGLF